MLREKNEDEELGMRYKPQLDAPCQDRQPERHFRHAKPGKTWERRMRRCPHRRWHRENLLGSTYFTCWGCGWRRRQAVPPTGGGLSPQDAERLFRARYPARHDAPPRRQHNEEVIRLWQEAARQERSPAEVARGVGARDMLQSDTYQQMAAQVHAAVELDGDVQVLARRYTAALQVLETRLKRLHGDRARQRQAKDSCGKGREYTAGRGDHQEAERGDGKAARNTGHPGPRCVSGRDKALAGYFYACVSLRQAVILDGRAFRRLRLVHQRLRHLFPGLPRDLPTHSYLATLTQRLFPRLALDKKADLKTKALDRVYAAARQGIKAPKRSLVCCSLLAAAVDAKLELAKKNVTVLKAFDCQHKMWPKVMALLRHLPRPAGHESEGEQPRLEELLDEEEPVPDPDCDLLMMTNRSLTKEEPQRTGRLSEDSHKPAAGKDEASDSQEDVTEMPVTTEARDADSDNIRVDITEPDTD